jgi:hypothetical protein
MGFETISNTGIPTEAIVRDMEGKGQAKEKNYEPLFG